MLTAAMRAVILLINLMMVCSLCLMAETGTAAVVLPDAPRVQQAAGSTGGASVRGEVTDTDHASIPSAKVSLEQVDSRVLRTVDSDAAGGYRFDAVAPGSYVVTIAAPGFAKWSIKQVLVVREADETVLPTVELGVEAIDTTVSAITIEDLAEQQITAEVHQRILGVLPNFYVSYVKNAAPLTRKQKFKLAAKVSTDPVTLFTTGVTAGIEQWQGDFSGYGNGFAGYSRRYGATYGDRLSSTFFGAAILPSLFHQDPRYFYKGTGPVVKRALYAIATTVICKGDNGRWQPNYSNVLGNLAAGLISSSYYPHSDQHSVQVTVDNTLVGVATGAFGTLFQEFMLKHLTHGVPKGTP